MSKLNFELVKANGCEMLFHDKNLWISVCDNTYEPTFGIYFGDTENYPEIDIDDISEKMVSDHLLTHSLAPYEDPDLLIRTSGEERLSNFLLWQMAYTEFSFSDKLWPDFDKTDLEELVKDYQGRNRRFGKV